jgi:hypothetical protein
MAFHPPSPSGDITINSTVIIGGADKEVLFNNVGTVGSSSSFTWDEPTEFLTITGGGIKLPVVQANDTNGVVINNSAGTLVASFGVGTTTISNFEGAIRGSGAPAGTGPAMWSDANTGTNAGRIFTDDTTGSQISYGALRVTVAGATITALNTNASIVVNGSSVDVTSQQIVNTFGSAGNITNKTVASTSGATGFWVMTAGADTGLTASTEVIDLDLDFDATMQHATGALTTQRSVVIRNRTYSFVAASTITTAATLAIVGAPIAGTNATITNSFALWVQAGIGRFDGGLESPGTGGTSSIRIGSGATAGNLNGIAIGSSSTTGGGGNAIAIGGAATSNASDSIGIGRSSNITHTASIGFGTGVTSTAAQQLIFGGPSSFGTDIENVYFGSNVTDTTPTSVIIQAAGGSGTNIAGASLTIAGGKATGNALGGNVVFQTSTAGSTGTTLQTLATRATIGSLIGLQMSSRLQRKQGADVASATNLTVGNDGDVFELTGTTKVDLINATNFQEGSVITLIANESVVIDHGTATSGSNTQILLAGAVDYSMTAGDTLSLCLSSTTAGGTAWREISRAII